MKVTVVTPADYSTGTQSYPVVYLLNGYGGSYRTWPCEVKANLDSLATVYNMIFVCPSGRDSWYFDSPLKPKMQMESFITRDLVPFIDANYRTIPDPAHRAITGLSMGGHGAMWLAIRHPEIWGNVGSTSGGVNISQFPNNWRIKEMIGSIDQYPQRWHDSSIVNLVSDIKPGTLNIIFDCGTDDFFYQVNCDLHEALLKAGMPHDFISRPGNHSRPYWHNAILYQLQYFNQQFKK